MLCTMFSYRSQDPRERRLIVTPTVTEKDTSYWSYIWPAMTQTNKCQLLSEIWQFKFLLKFENKGDDLRYFWRYYIFEIN